ncbi:MAG: glycosyltransferase [Candidatus Daviesbacteria bacterium]|nr:glycosyltransferase [Candidatus Daviesbacteria bacterium]
MRKLLSVIIPAYKQESTIKKDLENIDKTLERSLVGYDYEIICVVDGYLDKTLEEAQKIKSAKVKVVGYEHNKGKGYAVRFGIVRSKGNLVSFLDAGMDISPKGIMMLMAHMDWYDADIIVGSKRHPVSRVNYTLLRRILSIGYHFGVQILFDLPVTDTQSGLKIFKREVLEKVLPRLLVKRYAMDIEMLAVAKHLGFNRIYEAPIEVTFDKATAAVNWRTIFNMMWDSVAVLYRLRILHYYDDNNKRNWVFDPDLQFRVNIG